MRRITRLTPSVINKIIAEEKAKIEKQLEQEKSKEKEKLYEALKFLKKIKNRKEKSLKEQKIFDLMTKKIASKIKKGR